jgi:uncharacterized protein
MSRDPVPLFPLKTVLYPGGVLPLRIFETRYLDMIRRCLRNKQPFGVVAISEGAEVGPAETFPVGTLADVVDWRQESDGVLGITVVGGERFEVIDKSMQKDGLYVGRIDKLEPEDYVTLPPEHEDLAQLLRQVLPKIGSVYPHVAEAYDDATWVGYRLAEMLPLSLEDKQACLAMSDALERLDRLRSTFN